MPLNEQVLHKHTHKHQTYTYREKGGGTLITYIGDHNNIYNVYVYYCSYYYIFHITYRISPLFVIFAY